MRLFFVVRGRGENAVCYNEGMKNSNHDVRRTSARRAVIGLITFVGLFLSGSAFAVYSPVNYFRITYAPTIFSKTTVTNGRVFTVTIKSSGTAFENAPNAADAVRFSYRYTGVNKTTGEEVVLNPLQTLTVEPFPQNQGESYEATNVAPLQFPAGSAAGDYTVTETITNIEMKDVGFDWRAAPKPPKPAPPTKPSAPAKPAPPTKPSAPTQPSGPGGGGTEPSQPSEPTKLSEPTQPSEPTRPAEPAAPPGPSREIGMVIYAPAVAAEPESEPAAALRPAATPAPSKISLSSPTISAVTLSSASVTGGAMVTGTVTLSKTWFATAKITLSASPSTAITLPENATIPSGTTATFKIGTKTVITPTNVTITATFGNSKKTAAFTVNPEIAITVSALSVSPASVTGGDPAVGTVTLSGPAPASNKVVQLYASSNDALVFPGNVVVKSGATSATFDIKTKTVTAPVNVTVTATLDSSTKTAPLTINPAPAVCAGVCVRSDQPGPSGMIGQGTGGCKPVETGSYRCWFSTCYYYTPQVCYVPIPIPLILSVSPESVVNNISAVGTVILGYPAPAGGQVVQLSANTSAVTIPTNVTVNAGATSGTFDIKTSAVISTVRATIEATLGNYKGSAMLTINPTTVSAVTVSPASVINGSSAVGTVTLSAPAPLGGKIVLLSAPANSPIGLSSSVVVNAGETSGIFNITTNKVDSPVNVTITAAIPGFSSDNFYKTAQLTVNPTPLPAISLTISPAAVVNGDSSFGKVTLNKDVIGSGSKVVRFSATPSSIATLLKNLSLVNKTSYTFEIRTKTVTTPTNITITATVDDFQTSAILTVTPSPMVSTVTVSPAQLVGGAAAVGTVTLDSSASANGHVVMLSANTSGVSLSGDTITTSWYSWSPPPPQVTVKAGMTSATFKIQTNKVSSSVNVVITATANNLKKTASLAINPAPVACTDSDNGRNYTVKGSVKTATFSGNDNCDGSKLVEYYCLNSPSAYGDMFGVAEYNCPNGCKDGACLPAVVTPKPQTCTDSDGGKNYAVDGYVQSAGFTGYDNCVTGPWNGKTYPLTGELNEYYCSVDNKEAAVTYKCPYGCGTAIYGACLPAPR